MIERLSFVVARHTIVLALVAASACSTRVSRDNPYDPESSDALPGRVQGQLSAPTLASPQGIVVRLEGGPREVSPAVSDQDGVFLFDDVARGTYTLEVRHEGFWELVLRNLTVTVNQTLDLGVLTLIPLTETDEASVIQGTAQLEGAAQHGGVQVRVIGRPFDTLTGPQGSFMLEVPEGTHDLELSYPNYETLVIEDVVVGRASVVVLAEPVILRSDPATIAGVATRRTCAPNPAEEAVLAADGAVVSLLGTGHTGTVASDGSFAITGVPAGVYTLRLTLADHEAVEVAGLWVQGGQVLQLPEPLLTRAARGAVAGKVFYGGAASHDGVLVQLTGTGFMAFTAADGAFLIDAVCAGQGYELKAVPLQEGFGAATSGGLTVLANQVTTVPDITLARQQGGLTLAGGNAYSNAADRVVAYKLADVPDGTTQMRFSEDASDLDDPDFGWTAFLAEGTLTLSAGEGTKRVYAQVGDGTTVSSVLQDTIVLDLTAPGAPSIAVEDGRGFSNDPDGAVLVTVLASELASASVDAVSGLAHVKLVNHDLQAGTAPLSSPTDPAWAAAVMLTYNRTLEHPLLRPAVDEEKEIWLRVCDAAGNWSAPVATRVVLDRDDPDDVTFSIMGSAPGYANTTMVALAVTAADENPGIQMRLANDSAFLGAPWQPFAPNVPWTLRAGEGPKDVWMQLMDAAGNKTQIFSAAIELDTKAPVGVRLTVDEGPYSATRDLTLTLAAGDADEMVVALEPDFTDAGGLPLPWQTFSPAGQVLLPDRDGAYTVYAKYRDAAHNESVTSSAAVVLDRAAPQIAAASVMQGAHVSDPNITMLVTAVAGPSDAHLIRIDVEDVNSGVITVGGFVAFSPTVNVVLPAPAGDKRLHVMLQDAAGNTTPAATIVEVEYDPSAPQLAGVVVRGPSGGTTWTTSANVTVELDASGADHMLVSNRADFAGSSWTPFADSSAWTLPPHEALHTVHVMLRDLAGNTTTSQATITLDRSGPSSSSVQIDGGASYSTDGTVSLVLAASDGLSGMASVLLASDASFATPTVITWPAGAPSVTHADWSLAPGEGLRSVFARFIDSAGNTSDAAASIIVDTSAPQGTVAIDGGAAYTTSTVVQLTLSAPSDVQQVAFAEGASLDCATASYESFAATKTMSLGGQGARTVTVCFKDGAGLTASASDGIVVDGAPPSGTLSIDGGASYARSATVTLSLSVSNDVVAMAVANGVSLDCGAAQYESFVASRQWLLDAGQGIQSVQVCVRDAAGNQTLIGDSIEVDTLAPTGVTLKVNGGASYTASSDVTLSVTGSDANLSGVLISNDNDFTSSGLHATGDIAWTLAVGTGLRTVFARVVDEAGNHSDVAASIVVDPVAPGLGGVEIVGRNRDGSENRAATATTSVMLEITGSDAAELAVSTSAIADCDAVAYTQPFASLVPATLDAGGAVWVCARDVAGNTVGPVSDTITVDTSPPSCTVALQGYLADGLTTAPAGQTAVTSIEVAASCTGSPVAMAIVPSTQSLDCASAGYTTFQATSHVTVDASGAALKNVKACFKDAVGNYSATPVSAVDGLTYDGQAPQSGTLTIVRDGAAASAPASYTNSVDVDLYVQAVGATKMRFANAPDLSSVSWTGFSTSAQDWQLVDQATPCAAPAGEARTVYAQFADDLGNVSEVVAYSLVLDRCAPATPSVSIIASPGANAGYVRAFDVTVTVANVGEATRLRVSRLDGTGACPAPGTAESISAVSAFVATFASDGVKKVCVTAEDDAGNLSSTGTVTFTVDTTTPGSATLSPTTLTNVNKSCARVAPSGAADANFDRWEYRVNGQPWQTATLSSGKIQFTLRNDSDNLLEVRAVDKAGNAGNSNTAVVEEVSSLFVPTDLAVKRLCGANGTYALLWDPDVEPYVYPRDPNLRELALLNLDTLEVERLDGVGNLLASLLSADGDVGELHQTVDAMCNTQGNRLLVTYFGQGPAGSTDQALRRHRMAIVTDPTTLGAAVHHVGNGNPLPDPSALLDSVWFKDTDATYATAVMTVNLTRREPLISPTACIAGYRLIHAQTSVSGFSEISEMRRNEKSKSIADSSCDIAQGDYQFPTVYALRGIAMPPWNGSMFSHHAYIDGRSFVIANKVNGTSQTVHAYSTTYEFQDLWGKLVREAIWQPGASGTDASNVADYVYVSHAGGFYGGPVAGSATSLGSGGPLGADGEVLPAYETGDQNPGSMNPGWLSPTDQNGLVFGTSYGSPASTTRFRYAIDKNHPIYHSMRFGEGEAEVIYHTTGSIGRGVVIGFRDQSGCAE